MNKLKLFLLISFSSLLVSCSVIRSSYHYTKGTECAQNGDFEMARFHLEQACVLDPTMSRNYNNLAMTYVNLKQYDKAWYCVRQAAITDPGNIHGVENFYNFLTELEKLYNLQKGSTVEEVRKALDEPDEYYEEDEYISMRYGVVIMIFRENKLYAKKFISGVRDCWITPVTPQVL